MRGLTGLLCVALSAAAAAQTPQPFPTPRTTPGGQQGKPAPQPPPATPVPPPTTTPPPPSAPASPGPDKAATGTATAAAPAPVPDLGVPLYPNAVYLTSYDAGRGQRFYLYGVMLPYTEAVTFYRTALKQKGEELFPSPPTHQFELGRFREEDVAFPPSVTVKDYTWGGAAGYPNPKSGATPERFPTIIQIVAPGTAK